MSDSFDITIANDLGDLQRLAEAVEAFAVANGLSERLAFELNLCLDELVTNIVSYGYDDQSAHSIRIAAGRDGADRIRLLVEDDGRPFDPLAAPLADTAAGVEERPIGGLGIHFVRSKMDGMAYERDGDLNRLTMWRRADA